MVGSSHWFLSIVFGGADDWAKAGVAKYLCFRMRVEAFHRFRLYRRETFYALCEQSGRGVFNSETSPSERRDVASALKLNQMK